MKAHPEIKTEYIIKLYRSGMSLPEISEKIGITNQAVWERLKNAGVPRRGQSESVKLALKRGRTKLQYGEKHHSWKGGRNKDKCGYIIITIRQKRYCEHRVIWEKKYGKIPKGHIIHHLNGIRDDNRIENLTMLPRKRHSPTTIIKPYRKRIKYLENKLRRLKK